MNDPNAGKSRALLQPPPFDPVGIYEQLTADRERRWFQTGFWVGLFWKAREAAHD